MTVTHRQVYYADEGNYSPKSILVTGGAGFIASHVAKQLVQKYKSIKVVVFDKLDYCGSLKNIEDIEHYKNFKFIKGDLQSIDLLNYVLQTEQIDTVMHFAAQSHVDNSFGNSLAFTMNNTYGTHVLLEAVRAYGQVRRFINVSTDEVYGETSLGSEEGLKETSSLDPTNPYSAAKAGAEMMCKAYRQSYKLPIIVTRGNNVYGPHQFPEKLIPKFTLLAQRNESLPIHGDGGATRSYMFVQDVANAFECILFKGEVGETYNIGTQLERTVLSVAKDIADIVGLDSTKIKSVKDRAFNDRRYFIQCEKLANLGWVEKTTWEEGLRITIDWFINEGYNGYWDPKDIEVALRPHPARGVQQKAEKLNVY